MLTDRLARGLLDVTTQSEANTQQVKRKRTALIKGMVHYITEAKRLQRDKKLL